MASYEFKNNARSTVADNPLAAGATTLNVASGEGGNFPSAFPFKITLWDAVTYPNPGSDLLGMEIVKCTGRTADVLTIVRAQEGTADVAHSLGERAAMLITAGYFNDAITGIVTKLDTITDGANKITAESFSASVAHTTGDADAGKAFTIPSFPTHAQITAIRVRADWTAGQQSNTGTALINDVTGISPTDTAVTYDGAVADFAVGDYVNVDGERIRVTADSGTVLTVVRGLKGTVAAYHDDNAVLTKANHGLRLVIYKDSSKLYAERVIELSSMMTFKGVTDALITATDTKFGLTADMQNLGSGDFVIIEDTSDEECRVQEVKHNVASAADDYTIVVQDPLAAHDTTKDVKKAILFDLSVGCSSGTGTLYCGLFVDEAITGTVTTDVEIWTDSYT